MRYYRTDFYAATSDEGIAREVRTLQQILACPSPQTFKSADYYEEHRASRRKASELLGYALEEQAKRSRRHIAVERAEVQALRRAPSPQYTARTARPLRFMATTYLAAAGWEGSNIDTGYCLDAPEVLPAGAMTGMTRCPKFEEVPNFNNPVHQLTERA
jgi:hypothetical protein